MKFVRGRAHRFLTAGPKAMTRVLVTRPEPGATRTLEILKSRGHAAEIISLTEISPIGYDLPTHTFDAIIITSQNAIMHGAALLAAFKTKPVFTVGKRTADMLVTEGHIVLAWAETADDLLPLIKNHSHKNLLYISGQARRPQLETGLHAAGFQICTIETYRSSAMSNAADLLTVFFRSNEKAVILFYAPSAAQTFVEALRGTNPPVSTRYLCISNAVASQLPQSWQNAVTIAARPDDATMMAQLDKMLAHDHLPQA